MSIRVQIRKDLKDFTLDVSFEGNAKRIGILGESGAGKSMTLRCIAGIEQPDSGLIETDGKVLYDSGRKINRKPQNRAVGYLFQNYALFPAMTVLDNVAAGIRQGNRKEKREKAAGFLEKFGIIDLKNRLPREISGGQQQRTALARILASEPGTILLDEPFSALDSYLKDQMLMDLMEMLEEFPGSVIMVSHNRDEIYRFSEELLVLEKGHSLLFDKTKTVFADPKYKEAAKLTGCKNFCRIRRLDDHRFFAADWNIEISTGNKVPQDADWIGYRAHDFVPVWGPGQENCIPVKPGRTSELPFEYNYYVKPAGKEESPVIRWFVQREQVRDILENGFPDYLKVKEERIMYLMDSSRERKC